MALKPDVEHLLALLHEASERGLSDENAKFLDDRTRALVSIAAAVCVDAATPTLQLLVTWALASGATEDEVLGAFLAVAAAAGESRIVAVTPRLSLALGYDVDDALERA
jgi:alkylhydroperoxidase/carboxymuconolactone decarboxylase family protein YurZ